MAKMVSRPEDAPGYGEHFLKFCPAHCPCGYPCTTVISEDGRWRPPPMRITGWVGDGKYHEGHLPVGISD